MPALFATASHRPRYKRYTKDPKAVRVTILHEVDEGIGCRLWIPEKDGKGGISMMTGENTKSLKWYVVHTHPRQENRAESNLKLLEIETLAPRYKQRRQNEFRDDLYVINMMFPRYIFARLNLNDHYHKIRYTRGVHSLVMFDNNPAQVDEEVIDMIRLRMNDKGLVRMNDEIETGDEVVIKSGPFKNLRGIFERTANDYDRLLIVLDTISYQPRVIIDRNLVQKAAASNH